MYLWSVILPLFGVVLIFFFGKFLGKKGTVIAALTSLLLAWVSSFLIFFEVIYGAQPCSLKIFNWFFLGLFNVNLGLLFDFVSAVMLVIVLTISIFVHIYTIDYLNNDPYFIRFYIYLLIFTFFMLLLVSADNFLQMFFGWEGVGVASYLLINFWYTRVEANKAALKAMIINRIGDVGIYLTLIFLFVNFKEFSYYTIFELAPYISKEFFIFFEDCHINFLFLEKTYQLDFSFCVNKISILTFFVLIAAMSKSAQIGLHTWLPDAMEGPTPVSALLHAATMVTAGVFILIRLSPLFELAPNILFITTLVGALTAFFAAAIGTVQNDLKKVIAYSTCSQLGYMVFVCGLSGYSVALFHLFNHAFFKALLFLGAGVVIHALNDEQDMRKMGGIFKFLPITYISMLVGSLSLAGFPFFSGYYSKDLILEFSFASYEVNGLVFYWLGTLAAFFTAYYSIRLLYLVFLREYNGPKYNLKMLEEGSLLSIGPLMLLLSFSVLSGYVFRDLFVGVGSGSWLNSIMILKLHDLLLNAEFSLTVLKLIPSFFSLLGCFISFIIYTKLIFIFKFFSFFFLNKALRSFLIYKWYFDLINNNFFVNYFFYISYNILYKIIDRGFIEFFGPVGVVRFFNKFLLCFKRLYTGSLNHYVFFMLLCYHLFLIIGVNFSFFFNINFNIFLFICILFFLFNKK